MAGILLRAYSSTGNSFVWAWVCGWKYDVRAEILRFISGSLLSLTI